MNEFPIDDDISIMEPQPKKVDLINIDSDDEDDEGELKHHRPARPPVTLTLRPSPGTASCKPFELQFVSVGWKSVGCSYNDDFEKLGEAVVRRVGITRASMDRPAVVIDCRAFGRNQGPWKLVHHCGEHHDTLVVLLKHKYMKDMLTEVKATVLICEQHEQSSATILFVCTTGTHKSVAAARLAKESFAMSGYQTTVTHLSAGNWASRKKCSTCNNCKVGCQYKVPIFEHCKKILTNI
jgi:hypothetical protein